MESPTKMALGGKLYAEAMAEKILPPATEAILIELSPEEATEVGFSTKPNVGEAGHRPTGEVPSLSLVEVEAKLAPKEEAFLMRFALGGSSSWDPTRWTDCGTRRRCKRVSTTPRASDARSVVGGSESGQLVVDRKRQRGGQLLGTTDELTRRLEACRSARQAHRCWRTEL
ncbi:50S ribosomal protein L29 [Striga asiatica]|uniref:50S ribosomal protein L29 n=1 Tax=Striga asiatica TaxID=4170 RepID=A0A5A7P0F6_STRAF|nr:50S ribosomal protein L29 [Striga asiatica]